MQKLVLLVVSLTALLQYVRTDSCFMSQCDHALSGSQIINLKLGPPKAKQPKVYWTNNRLSSGRGLGCSATQSDGPAVLLCSTNNNTGPLEDQGVFSLNPTNGSSIWKSSEASAAKGAERDAVYADPLGLQAIVRDSRQVTSLSFTDGNIVFQVTGETNFAPVWLPETQFVVLGGESRLGTVVSLSPLGFTYASLDFPATVNGRNGTFFLRSSMPSVDSCMYALTTFVSTPALDSPVSRLYALEAVHDIGYRIQTRWELTLSGNASSLGTPVLLSTQLKTVILATLIDSQTFSLAAVLDKGNSAQLLWKNPFTFPNSEGALQIHFFQNASQEGEGFWVYSSQQKGCQLFRIDVSSGEVADILSLKELFVTGDCYLTSLVHPVSFLDRGLWVLVARNCTANSAATNCVSVLGGYDPEAKRFEWTFSLGSVVSVGQLPVIKMSETSYSVVVSTVQHGVISVLLS